MVILHGSKGCGSAAIEALLELAVVPYQREMIDWEDPAAWERLAAVNPLKQVPTLVIDGGQVLTESAAIMLWILDRDLAAPLITARGSAARAQLYRWLVFIPANVYAPITVGDFPERWVDGEAARASLKAHAVERVQAAWGIMEQALNPAPYLLGETLSALDVYVAMVSRWRPGRAWFEAHCPKLAAAVKLAEQHPVVAAVWARNFA